jgi:hypothetical protein
VSRQFPGPLTESVNQLADNKLAKATPTTLAPAPDYITKGRQGLETIDKSDILIPRLALAQALSPQVTEGDPKFVPGMKPGDLFNSMTGENYGQRVEVQIIRKDKLRAMEFYSIDDGGGVKDPNVALSDDRLKWGNSGDKKADKPKATLFRDYVAVLLPSREMIALSFKSSGIKVAKALNGLIILRGQRPIYAGKFAITTGTELVPKPHKVYKVDNADWVSPEDFELGAQMWEAVKDMDVKVHEETVDEVDDFDNQF